MDRQKWRLWAERVWRFEQSGLTGAEWCRREGLPLEQFYVWRRKLQVHGVVPADPEAAELAMLLSGVSLATARLRPRYQVPHHAQ